MGMVKLFSRACTVALVLTACASGGVAEAAPAVHLPPSAGVFDYQIGGAYTPSSGVKIVDRDRTDAPVRGKYNVCYVNGFQTQPNEVAYWRKYHRSLLLKVGGHYVHDPNWPDEYILDTSTVAKRKALVAIVGRWFDGCARKGYQAVEPDNLDSWTRKGVKGAITRTDNMKFAGGLIARAHAKGLAIGQKNTVEISASARKMGFDFAIAEECEVYRECSGYTDHYGKRVLEVEYTDTPRAVYSRACKARHGKASIILRDRNVVPRGHKGYRYEHC